MKQNIYATFSRLVQIMFAIKCYWINKAFKFLLNVPFTTIKSNMGDSKMQWTKPWIFSLLLYITVLEVKCFCIFAFSTTQARDSTGPMVMDRALKCKALIVISLSTSRISTVCVLSLSYHLSPLHSLAKIIFSPWELLLYQCAGCLY